MATSGDLIDFEVIESHKENIQALPNGRSAKALAQIYSPPLLGANASPAFTNDAQTKARGAFERELLQADEADDPLDIYDRYVKWTLDTYPSAQATPQSQLLPLLERATKAFQSSAQYKNDSRYLKLWLQYIRLFSDAPREVFVFLARNNIGESLAVYYEEYAAWLENAGRRNQAEEIYQLGLERGARPVERLSRKFQEFSRRKNAQTDIVAEPTSPALPAARPALAAKLDPYAASTPQQSASSTTKKAKSSKMQIFADSEEIARPSSGASLKGWDNLGTISDRKKENHIAPKPMAGETLKVGKTNGGMQKMMIFRDTFSKKPSLPRHLTDPARRSAHAKQCVVNPKNGRLECVAVNLEAVYPGPKRTELSFEELRAQNRGWQAGTYSREARTVSARNANASPQRKQGGFKIFEDSQEDTIEKGDQSLARRFNAALDLDQENDENSPPGAGAVSVPAPRKKSRKEDRANRTRKIEMPDVKHIKNDTTKTIQLNMASHTGVKPKRKKSIGRGDATMTINTKEAMDEIYGIFSQPLASQAEVPSIDDDESSEDDCSTDGDSTGTGKLSAPASEYGDETKNELFGSAREETNGHDEDTAWSDYNVKDLSRGQISKDAETETITTPLEGNFQTHTVPILPENDDLPTYSHRAYNAIPNHRLPFMTPIAEATESSLGTLTLHKQKDLLTAKTPSRQTGTLPTVYDENDLLSSPFQDVTTDLTHVKQSILQPVRTKSTKGTLSLGQGSVKAQHAAQIDILDESPYTGPIVTELQCNPMDPLLREHILAQMKPSMSTFRGYRSYNCKSGRTAEIKRWAKAVAKSTKGRASFDRANPSTLTPVLSFGGSDTTYTFRRELGAGTFAPVYLVESSAASEERVNQLAHRTTLEAIKMEDPPSVWEYYMLNQAHRRLGVGRTADSIIRAHEMHVYQDECFLVEQYRDQGTLLDLVNTCRLENTNATGMDEMLAMWLTVELLRTVEALHAKQIIHGDLKGDNMMVRFDDPGLETDWSSTYFPSGAHGWSSKGVSLIDFGRGIDMKHFMPNVGFVADWKTTDADCAEMRELRPWTYQIDYYGLAGTIHSMLFGKYMETISERGSGLGATKTYRIRETFKRYWQTEIWNDVFQLLLNPTAHLDDEEGGKMPVLRGMRSCRENMESWLEENCEKGIGLKGMILKLEASIKDRKRKARVDA
ncbi:hypothetical protein AMS68_005340 [Peltaster fructicola]|uniref:Protein kinase domain-containing protein n=1 Tax=Peltaster fructicola TaxID=286661 RepID=A0A6H0XYJ1_9PEZI|nr:hypothetical protein AMS68_005340 [Peltaster fructicola]